MKKCLLVLLVVLLMPISASLAEIYYKLGDSDPGIIAIKYRLAELGYYSNSERTERFTRELYDAVSDFQKSIDTKWTGMVDELTYAAMFNEPLEHQTTVNTDYNISIITIDENGSQQSHTVVPMYTPTVTPNPTPKVILPSALTEESYKQGDAGEAIMLLKIRLQNLGYYIHGASMSNEYNGIMTERVKMFQRNNGLEETGVIDEACMYSMYAPNAVKSDEFTTPTPRPTNTPKPTPSPYKEPKYLLQQSEYARWGTSYGTPWFEVGVKNVSKSKTVDGVTIEYYCTNVYGEKMAYSGSTHFQEVLNVKIRPGKTTYLPKISLHFFSNTKRVYQRIARIHMTDGTDVVYPESDAGIFWYIEYETK